MCQDVNGRETIRSRYLLCVSRHKAMMMEVNRWIKKARVIAYDTSSEASLYPGGPKTYSLTLLCICEQRFVSIPWNGSPFLGLQVGFQRDWRSLGRQDTFFYWQEKKIWKREPYYHSDTDVCDDMCGPVRLYPRGEKLFWQKFVPLFIKFLFLSFVRQSLTHL